MVPWAQLFAFQIIWIYSGFAGASRPVHHTSEGDLKAEFEEYLRALSQRQHAYQRPVQSADEDINPYFPMKPSPQYMPSDEYVPDQEEDDDKIEKTQLPLRGLARAFALSSAQVKFPMQYDARTTAYSSVKDVESDGLFDENDDMNSPISMKVTEKKAESSQHMMTISDALPRKSESLTTAQMNSETTKAESFGDVYFVAIVAGCSAAGIFGIISAGFCFYRMQKANKASAEVEYPAYGVTGPSKDTASPNGDRKLAQSAQMYHYQHQKQQMIAVEKAGSTKNTSASDVDSEEENEEGDYTVYECPGLAPTGEMEVKNPLFNDDSTPMSPPVCPTKPDNIQAK